MQRTKLLAHSAALLIMATHVNWAVAGDYAYAMAASDDVDSPASPEPAATAGIGSNNRVEGMGARYFVSQDEAPASSVRRTEEIEQPAAAQATLPSGSSGPASDKRTSHRWQSLVPGAIK